MRSLEINKSSFWMVRPTGFTDVMDGQGRYTGEKIATFSDPVKLRFNVFPNDGTITTTVKGQIEEFDFIGVSEELGIVSKDDLLFILQPVDEFDLTYDYKVGRILQSINVIKFTLEARV